jgi:hypothetical protein
VFFLFFTNKPQLFKFSFSPDFQMYAGEKVKDYLENIQKNFWGWEKPPSRKI